jgi:serine/threonine-protein kinase
MTTVDGQFQPGAVIGALYRLERHIASGSVGEVWAGWTLDGELRVALKRLHPQVAGDARMLKRFKREAQFMSRIRSEHVAKVLNVVVDPHYGTVLVVEYIEGRCLADVLDDANLSVEAAVALAIDLTVGLRDLHLSGVIHRDIKPANVILRSLPAGGTRGVLCDFGVSRLAHTREDSRASIPAFDDMPPTSPSMAAELTPSNAVLGTLQYMSPEQILSSRDVDPQTDIYALGAMLYRAVSGEHQFDCSGGKRAAAQAKLLTDPPRLVTGRLDPIAVGLEDIVDRATRRLASERYANANEMLDELLTLHNLAVEAEQALEAANRQPTVHMTRQGTILMGRQNTIPMASPLPPPPSPTEAEAHQHWTHQASTLPLPLPSPPPPPDFLEAAPHVEEQPQALDASQSEVAELQPEAALAESDTMGEAVVETEAAAELAPRRPWVLVAFVIALITTFALGMLAPHLLTWIRAR